MALVPDLKLVEGAIYEVTWPEDHIWAEFTTIMKFYKKFYNGYVFFILCPKHLHLVGEAHGFGRDTITYGYEDLKTAKFNRSLALDVLYGEKA